MHWPRVSAKVDLLHLRAHGLGNGDEHHRQRPLSGMDRPYNM